MSVDPRQLGKVAVLMGGKSAEREISLKSGNAVLAGLQRKGVDAHGIDAGDDLLMVLQQGGYERVFNALHGRGGEDGVIQGALETLGLPYTGSGVMASALSMDKLRSKQIWQAMALPTPEMIWVESEQDLEQAAEKLGLPLVVKPAHEGSSVGMSKISDPSQIAAAWEMASRFDDCVMAERWVTGGEYTVAILGDEVLPPIKVETPNEFYDFEAKYQANTTQYLIPCGLSEEKISELQQLAKAAFKALDAKGWGRVDVMQDQSGKFWLIELNSVPGMTETSLVPKAARAAGIEFDELVLRILSQTLEVNG